MKLIQVTLLITSICSTLLSNHNPPYDDPFVKRSIDINCPATIQDCQSIFSNCSNHGNCTKQNHPRKTNTQCFFCDCSVKKFTDDKGNLLKNYNGYVKWSGQACQSQDISTPFHILFWSSIGLFLATFFTIGLLYSIGERDGSDYGPSQGKPKMD